MADKYQHVYGTHVTSEKGKMDTAREYTTI